jgi:hypothetical protein
MFGLFKSPIEKKAEVAAQAFYSKLLRWEFVLGHNKLTSWLEVDKAPSFVQNLNICFKQVQIWEGARILNKVAPPEYTTPFGKEIRRLMDMEHENLMKLFVNLSTFVAANPTKLYNPTESLAKWILLNAVSIQHPSEKQLREVTTDVHMASVAVHEILTVLCQDFRFPKELIIKEYDPSASLDKFILDIR